MSAAESVSEICMSDLAASHIKMNWNQQTEVARRFREKHIPEDRDLLMRSGIRWGIKLAQRYARAYGADGLFLDLVQEAMMGLAVAAERYDPDRVPWAAFSTYATYWIRRYLMAFLLEHLGGI